MRNKLFSLILVGLFCFALLIIVKPQKEESSLEKRELFEREDFKITTLFNGTATKEIDTLLKDQFVARDNLMQGYYELKIALTKTLTSEGSDDNILVLADDVLELGEGYLTNNITIYDETYANIASLRGYNINQIDLKYPDIKTYVYLPTRIEEYLYLPGNNIPNYGFQYRRNFMVELNDNIKVSELHNNSIDKHKEWFYKTDFHWNNKGAYQGYSDMINMIREDYEIDQPRAIKEEICYPHEFIGNIASKIGQIGKHDYICDYSLDNIKDYKKTINGEAFVFDTIKNKYLYEGNTTMYSDYDLYFGQNEFERVFNFFQPEKPNILVFCDSYFNVIQEWFASHFNKTVLIDMRANDGDFSLENYINDYDIDIILVCQMYKNLYFNGFMFIPIE